MNLARRAAVAALAVAASFPVYGTLVPALSFEELVRDSETVVHGRVASVRVGWDADHAAIWTYYEIVPQEAFKGSPGPALIIQEPGGEIDGLKMEVVGAPRYQVGEEVVVFAARAPLGLRTCGWGQGRFVVEGDPGRKRVRRELGDIQLVSARGRASPAGQGAAPDQDLEAFKQKIRNEVLRQERSAAQTAR